MTRAVRMTRVTHMPCMSRMATRRTCMARHMHAICMPRNSAARSHLASSNRNCLMVSSSSSFGAGTAPTEACEREGDTVMVCAAQTDLMKSWMLRLICIGLRNPPLPGACGVAYSLWIHRVGLKHSATPRGAAQGAMCSAAVATGYPHSWMPSGLAGIMAPRRAYAARRNGGLLLFSEHKHPLSSEKLPLTPN